MDWASATSTRSDRWSMNPGCVWDSRANLVISYYLMHGMWSWLGGSSSTRSRPLRYARDSSLWFRCSPADYVTHTYTEYSECRPNVPNKGIWRSSAVVDVMMRSRISQHSHAVHHCSEWNEEGRSGRVVGMLDKPPVIISLVVKVPHTRHSGLEWRTLLHETTKLPLHFQGCTPLSSGSL